MVLEPGQLTLEQLQAIHTARTPLEIPQNARSWIRASADLVQRALHAEAPIYGVNTGFGKLASQSIGREQVITVGCRPDDRGRCVTLDFGEGEVERQTKRPPEGGLSVL